MVTRVVLLVALAACAQTQRHVAHVCPSKKPLVEDFLGTLPQLADFAITGVLLATAAYELNNGRGDVALVAAGVGMGVALSSNLAECHR